MTDVNPRFGGGFPLPTAAGSRYPELALALAARRAARAAARRLPEGVVMTRFFPQMMLVRDAAGTLEPLEEPALEEA